MSFPFGKAFTYTYYPLDDNENLSASDIASIESLLVAVYIFTDEEKPSRDEAISGSGATQTIASWSDNGNLGFDISVAALDDPDPTIIDDERDFWISINYRLEAGEQVQTILRRMRMERIRGHHKRIQVTDTDLKRVWPEIDRYTEDITERLRYTEQAISDIERDMENRRLEWSLHWRPDKLTRAAVYRTLFYAARAKQQVLGDKFNLLKEDFDKEYNQHIARLNILYDEDNDGDPIVERKAAGQVIFGR